MSDPFRWDVFVSHSSADKPRVEKLVSRLRAEGLKVWFDRATIGPGADIVSSVEEGVEQSRVFLLCMSPNAFESDWVTTERNIASFRDPMNHDRRFLPVLFESCELPAQLRRLKYVDWSGESLDALPEILAFLHPGAEPVGEIPLDLRLAAKPVMACFVDATKGYSRFLSDCSYQDEGSPDPRRAWAMLRS